MAKKRSKAGTGTDAEPQDARARRIERLRAALAEALAKLSRRPAAPDRDSVAT